VVNPQRRFQPKPKRQPVFLAKSKDENGYWRTIGAAWGFRDGSEGYSIRLVAIPVQWDGRFTLFPPNPEEEIPDHDPETGELR